MPLVLLALSLFGAPDTQAATPHFSVLTNTPVRGSSGVINTFGSKVIKNKFSFSFDTNYGYAYRSINTKPGGLVNHLLVHNFGFSYSPDSKWQFDLVVPLASYNRFHSVPANGIDTAATINNYNNHFGFGDLILQAHFNVWRSANDLQGFALMPFISVPTGNETYNLGDHYPRGGIKLIADWQITPRLYSAINLGFEARQTLSNRKYQQKGRLLGNAGLGYMVFPGFVLNAEAQTATAIDRPLMDKATTGIDLLGGVSYKLQDHPVKIAASAGGPLIQTAIQPKFQANLGVSVGFKNKNTGPNAKELKALEPVLYFDFDSTTLQKTESKKLTRVAKLLKKYPRVKLVVAEGHTDASGTKHYNKKLSLQRANAVKNHLVSQYISEKRIQVQGFGKSRPVAPNNTPQGQAENRRVEIKVKILQRP